MKFEIAGHTLTDHFEGVCAYLRNHERMLREFDLGERPGGPNEITPRDVLQTRYTNLRIDSSELQYFIDEARSAPWHKVPPRARLVDADPAVKGGLYDDAEDFYRHFYSGRRRGLTPAKLHMVLHFKRPALIPLLDGRLHDLYEDAAREASRAIRDVRRGRRGRLYWAAIRNDLIRNADALEELRDALAERDEPESLGSKLTDVRLHDVVCWVVVGTRH